MILDGYALKRASGSNEVVHDSCSLQGVQIPWSRYKNLDIVLRIEDPAGSGQSSGHCEFGVALGKSCHKLIPSFVVNLRGFMF